MKSKIKSKTIEGKKYIKRNPEHVEEKQVNENWVEKQNSKRKRWTKERIIVFWFKAVAKKFK